MHGVDIRAWGGWEGGKGVGMGGCCMKINGMGVYTGGMRRDASSQGRSMRCADAWRTPATLLEVPGARARLLDAGRGRCPGARYVLRDVFS